MGLRPRYADPNEGVARNEPGQFFFVQILRAWWAHGEDHIAYVGGAVVDEDLDVFWRFEAELAHHGSGFLTARERYSKLLYQSGGRPTMARG